MQAQRRWLASASGSRRRMRSPITGRNSPKSSNCWRRSWTELRRSKHTRFPTQPFTRSPLTSQRDDDNFCSTLRFDGVVSTGGELGLAPAFVHSKNCGAPNCFHFAIVHRTLLRRTIQPLLSPQFIGGDSIKITVLSDLYYGTEDDDEW